MEILQNNEEALQNIQTSEINLREAKKIADSIISDAENIVQSQESEIVNREIIDQQAIIREILTKQNELLKYDNIRDAVCEAATIVLRKIGLNPNEDEIKKIAQNIKDVA